MIRLLRWMIWLMVALIVVTLLDQVLIRVPLKVPVVEQFQSFYVDFRGRLVAVVSRQQDGPSIEEKIRERQEAQAAKKASAPMFLYADESGELHFADRLEDIPPAYRKDAQPMEP